MGAPEPEVVPEQLFSVALVGMNSSNPFEYV